MLNIKPDPDFSRLRKVLKNEGEPDRVPFYELFADKPIMEAVLGRSVEGVKDLIDFQYQLGYDYVSLSASRHLPNFSFPTEGLGVGRDTAELSKGERAFNTASMGVIDNWDDFESYPWPVKEEIDFSPVEEALKIVPEGMGVIVRIGHQLEYPMNLMGYEGLSFALFDQPDLVEAIFNKVGEIFLYTFKTCAQIGNIGAMEISDDLGFKTSTMFSPEMLRKYVFPWYKKFVDVSHQYDVPVILHSCGNLESVMDDLIEAGIDAKHSFEDQIISVIDFKKRYGDRLAVLGGIDVDFLCRSSEEEVRQRTREVLKECKPGGGYALGTGNSVANYIPVRNYLAMLDEGWKAGRY